MTQPDDLELMSLAAELAMDGRGRLAGVRGIALAVTADGQRLLVGSDLRDDVNPRLSAAVTRSALPPSPDREPPALAACRRVLAPYVAPLTVEAGPYYVF